MEQSINTVSTVDIKFEGGYTPPVFSGAHPPYNLYTLYFHKVPEEYKYKDAEETIHKNPFLIKFTTFRNFKLWQL